MIVLKILFLIINWIIAHRNEISKELEIYASVCGYSHWFSMQERSFSRNVRTEKYSLNHVKLIPIFRFNFPFSGWFGTKRNQSENGKYNLISVCFSKIQKRFLCNSAGYLSMGTRRYSFVMSEGFQGVSTSKALHAFLYMCYDIYKIRLNGSHIIDENVIYCSM